MRYAPELIHVFISNTPSIVCFIAAFLLARHGIGGWGWFLFVGVLVTKTFSFIRD